MAAVIAEAEPGECAQGGVVGRKIAPAKGDRIGRTGLDQQITCAGDQIVLGLIIVAGEMALARIGALAGLGPHRVEMQLDLLPGRQDRLNHAADRLDPEKTGRHRIDEETGFQRMACKDAQLIFNTDAGSHIAAFERLSPMRPVVARPPGQLGVDGQKNTRSPGYCLRRCQIGLPGHPVPSAIRGSVSLDRPPAFSAGRPT